MNGRRVDHKALYLYEAFGFDTRVKSSFEGFKQKSGMFCLTF